MTPIFIHNLNDLIEIQRASYYRFLSIGISKALLKFPNPFIIEIENDTDFILNAIENENTSLITSSFYKGHFLAFVYLSSNDIKLKSPVTSLAMCLEHDLSYSIPLYISSEYCYIIDDISRYSVIIKQDFFWGEIPLITEDGTFIIQGCERVVVNQIIRSPGFYFSKTFNNSGITLYTATIISSNGLWTKVVLEDESEEDTREKKRRDTFFKPRFYLEFKSSEQQIQTSEFGSLDNSFFDHLQESFLESNLNIIQVTNKVSLYDILIYLGLTDAEIIDCLTYPEDFPWNTLNYSDSRECKKQELLIKINEEALHRLKRRILLTNNTKVKVQLLKQHKKFRKKLHLINESLRNEEDFFAYYQDLYKINTEIILQKIVNEENAGYFLLGSLGRYKINTSFGTTIPESMDFLTIPDFFIIINNLMELKYFNRASDDIDHITNKQIRGIGELLQMRFSMQLSLLENNLIKFPLKEQESDILESQEEGYRTENDIVLDNVPMSEVTKFKRWSYPLNYFMRYPFDCTFFKDSIKDFFQISQLSQFLDQTNPIAELSHKRKLSLFGPNGLKRDNISVALRGLHPSRYGRLCPIDTTEGSSVGLVMSLALLSHINSLGLLEVPYFVVNKGSLLGEKSVVFLDPLKELKIPIAFGDSALALDNTLIEKSLTVKKDMILSIEKTKSIQLITMSAFQLISLATTLIPFLEHNDITRALMASNMQRQAVPLLYPQKPIVGTGLESMLLIDSEMIIKSYCQGFVEMASSILITIKDASCQKITYYLKKYIRSNQKTSLNQIPIVWAGENVFSGQIIADGASTNDGELSLGCNLTSAYMLWEGYNFEDAIIISDQVVFKNCLTSICLHKCELDTKNFTTEIITNDLPFLLEKKEYINLDYTGFIKLGTYVKENDTLIGIIKPEEEKEKAEEVSLISHLHKHKSTPIILKKKTPLNVSFKVPMGIKGQVIDICIFGKKMPQGVINSPIFCISIAEIRPIQIGDKLAGRHGNKGVVAKIVPRQDMPYLPNGIPIDIILNPLGVPSRMNLGQIFEGLLGFAGDCLGKRFKVSPFDEIYGSDASQILINQKLKEVASTTNLPWVFNTLYPGKILLRDGRTGEYFDNPVTVGKSYILKLIHLSEDKIYARGTGPYNEVTDQPQAGKKNKGGQRFGEMETWAIMAYGCANTLQEILTLKSDDIYGRKSFYESCIVGNNIRKPNPSFPGAFLILMRELHALGLDFSLNLVTNPLSSTLNLKCLEKDVFEQIENRLHFIERIKKRPNIPRSKLFANYNI